MSNTENGAPKIRTGAMLSKPNHASTTLYSLPQALPSHTIRFVMAEKNIESDIVVIKNPAQLPEDILDFNPGRVMPTLYDRGMTLYDMTVIMEYLDERFPFPPLLPIDPIKKAEKRLFIYRFTRAKNSWYELAKTILESQNKKARDTARKILTGDLIDLMPMFDRPHLFFKSTELSAVDTILAPLFWRLGKMEIELPAAASPIKNYMKRIFSRQSFKNSLTDSEREFDPGG